MSHSSHTPSLTPSRSPSPVPPVQPDHFYGSENVPMPHSPGSNDKMWLDPEDDPLAHRGIPVFRPTMDEFEDFEAYVTKIERWGMHSGILKVIPPKEWTDMLPTLKDQLLPVKIKSPIEQHMIGRGGLFRQENIEKRRVLSVREWVELCRKEEYKAPGVEDVGLHARSVASKVNPISRRKRAGVERSGTTDPEPGDELRIKQESKNGCIAAEDSNDSRASNALSVSSECGTTPTTPTACDGPSSERLRNTDCDVTQDTDSIPSRTAENATKAKTKASAQTREAKEANIAARMARDLAFLESFDPHSHWLPPKTTALDYTPEFCQKLERQYWRNCGLGKPAWYGADSQGSLYTDETKIWNVAHLPSTLSRLLPTSSKGLPGVNTPYLYFGMWRATFAWHVEDMDLFSINFIHFGAPKFWYSVPQGRAGALEQTMRSYFPKDTSQCPQFLRHKSFLASPTLLAQSSCRPNVLVQHAGEFVITFPRGYHAGFNLGLNCAESVNFALDSWLELGKRAQVCQCMSDSVRIDVAQLLLDREMELSNPTANSMSWQSTELELDKDSKGKGRRKRQSYESGELPKAKKVKTNESSSNGPPPLSSSKFSTSRTVTLKLGPRPAEPETFPCCLCVSFAQEGLLRVHDPPVGRKDAEEAADHPTVWMAHEECANVVPETWVDEMEANSDEDGVMSKEKVVFGVDGIVKDRWNLRCSACLKGRQKAHGAPIQCTKGKCPKAFHVSCARNGGDNGVVFCILREVEKEVVLLGQHAETTRPKNTIGLASLEPTSVDANEETISGITQLTPDVSPIDPLVLKVIRKTEVQVLCTQHNPAVAAAKKATKQARIRQDLIALPPMARIKIRVSAGVFEVSLIRVIEDTNSVEVLWDRGIKREFKWGSVVFGNTDGQTVLQKPSDLTLEPEQKSSASMMTIPSVFAATHHSPLAAVTQLHPHTLPLGYEAWSHLSKDKHSQSQQSAYTGHYRDSSAVSLVRHHHGQHYYPSQYRGESQLQKPCDGPRLYSSPQPYAPYTQQGADEIPSVDSGSKPATAGASWLGLSKMLLSPNSLVNSEASTADFVKQDS